MLCDGFLTFVFFFLRIMFLQPKMDVGLFFFTHPNPPITYLQYVKCRHRYCRTRRIFTCPLFREFLDHVSVSKIKERDNVYL